MVQINMKFRDEARTGDINLEDVKVWLVFRIMEPGGYPFVRKCRQKSQEMIPGAHHHAEAGERKESPQTNLRPSGQ